MRKFKKIMLILSFLAMTVMFTSCSIIDTVESLPIFEDNTTVKEAIVDSQTIMKALAEANEAMRKGDTRVFGEKVLSEGLSYKDVIDKKDLKSAAETKRYKETVYHLYWDTDSHSPFWSTDGSDDIRNADGNFNITHKNSKRIINNTPVTDLK